ncbi:MAG: pro-sigmaK processing inhibitor BofA family protein [Halobacteria archaeon]
MVVAAEIGALAVAIATIVLLYYFLKTLKALVWNTIVGFVVVFAAGFLGIVQVAITPLTVVIVAIGGIPGAVILMLLSYFRIAFHPGLILPMLI